MISCRRNLASREGYGLLSLLVICIIGAFGYYRQLTRGADCYRYARLCFLGNLYFQFCFFCCHQPGGITDYCCSQIVNFGWSTPLTRIAEIIAVSAITFASIIIVVDMGRPDRFYNLFIHTRLQSPIVWDVIVITTYFFISLLLLYFPLLPDLRILIKARKDAGKRRGGIYAFLGSFWKNTPEQIQINKRSVQILCITIIPVAFCCSYSNIMVVCHDLPAGLGQHQFWCIFYFRRISRWCRCYPGGHVCIPVCV